MTAPWGVTANELPDLRLWLFHQWQPYRAFHVLARQSERSQRFTDSWARMEAYTLTEASLWWVGEDMVDLLLAAAAGVPDDVRAIDVDPPARSGLLVFEKPWRLDIEWGDEDGDSATLEITALTWHRMKFSIAGGGAVAGIAVAAYTRLDIRESDDGALVNIGLEDTCIPVGLHEALHDSFDAGWLPGDWGLRADATGPLWVPFGVSIWEADKPLTWVAPEVHPANAERWVATSRVFAAFCSLIAQEGIAQTEKRPPNRQAVRRQVRAGVAPPAASDLRIIRLRPVHRTDSAPADGQAHREWSHRWIVNGHWRWAAVGKGRAERRLTYVRPHVKGPDDKPLVVKQEVRAWVQ